MAQSPLEEAVVLARQKHYAEAAQRLQGVPEPAPPQQRIAFHRLKAAIASGLGNAGEAADEIEAALAEAPSDESLKAAASVAELSAGRLDAALAHARELSASAAAEALTGSIQEKRADYVEAAKAYQNAIALAPDREEYRIHLALEFIQHYTFEPAVTVLEQAAPLFPRSAKIRMLLGLADYAVSRTEEGITALTEAVEIDPSLEPAWNYLATLALDSGAPPRRTADALCRWNEVICGAVELRLAREQNDAELRAQAIRKLQLAPAGNSIARCGLGRDYESSGDWPDARREMEACVRLDPSAQNHYRLGLVYSALQLPDLARAQMKLREDAAAKMAGENTRRGDAIQAFQYVLK